MNNVHELCALIRDVLAETPARVDAEIEPLTPLLVSGLLDSLTIMMIVTRVERDADVEFPEGEVVAANFRTPTALWDLVVSLRPQESVAR